MEAVRMFIIRNRKMLFGTVIGGMLVFCIAITAKAYPIGWLLAGSILLVLSLLCYMGHVGKHSDGKWEDGLSFLLLGAAVYCFPAAGAVLPFYLAEILKKRKLLGCGGCFLAGLYLPGISHIVSRADLFWPFHRLLFWLNTDNVFDHNLSFWSLVTGREQLRFGMVAVLMTMGILLIGFYLYSDGQLHREDFLVWTAWTCLLFLPYGHAEDGFTLVWVLLIADFGRLRDRRLYQLVLLTELTETLFMLGSAYGGYERFGYDFYQMAVGVNVLLWLLFTYRGIGHLWTGNRESAEGK